MSTDINPETRRRRWVAEQRLAASLRANLARRKAQDRTRQALAAGAAVPDESGAAETADGSGTGEQAA